MMKGLFPVVTNSDFVFPDTIFDNFFNGFENPTEANYRVPQVDIEDTDKAYILTTDLTGVAKEDINVSNKDDVLTLTAKHEEKKDVLNNCDILVDGPFVIDLYDAKLAFRGSSNQRIIDLKHSTNSIPKILNID